MKLYKKFFCFIPFLLFSQNALALTIEEAFISCQNWIDSNQSVPENWACRDNSSLSRVEGYIIAQPESIFFNATYSETCPDGTIINPDTGICDPEPDPEPDPCEPGMTLELGVLYHETTEVVCFGACSTYLDYAGCEYLRGDYTGSCYSVDTDSEKKTYCTYTATSTGNPSSGHPPAIPPPNPPDHPDYDPQSDPDTTPADPCTDINGLDICIADHKDCIDVNGQNICVVTETDCGLLNGKVVCADDPKNCGLLNGEYVCIDTQIPTYDTTCMQDPNSDLCLSGKPGVKSDTSTSVSTAPDGTTTSTTTTTTNVIGDPDVVTTTVNNPDGTSTSTTTGEGDPDAEQTSSEQAGNELLEKILKENKETNENLVKLVGEDDDFDTTSFEAKLNQDGDNLIASLLSDLNNFTSPFSDILFNKQLTGCHLCQVLLVVVQLVQQFLVDHLFLILAYV